MLNIEPTLEQTFRARAHARGLTDDEYFAQLLEDAEYFAQRLDGDEDVALLARQPTSKTPLPETPEETKARVQALLTKWQAEDGSYFPVERKTLAELSAKWAAEDTNLTDEEREGELLFWEERERDHERWYVPKG